MLYSETCTEPDIFSHNYNHQITISESVPYKKQTFLEHLQLPSELEFLIRSADPLNILLWPRKQELNPKNKHPKPISVDMVWASHRESIWSLEEVLAYHIDDEKYWRPSGLHNNWNYLCQLQRRQHSIIAKHAVV